MPAETLQRVLDLTVCEPPGEATHWTLRMMAKRWSMGNRQGHLPGVQTGVTSIQFTAMPSQRPSSLIPRSLGRCGFSTSSDTRRPWPPD